MPMVESPDGTLWIDIQDISEVDLIRRRLRELGVSVTALVPDPTCGVTVEEVEWVDLYPKIVPRNGPEPGIIVQPADIPPGHTLLLGTHTVAGASHPRTVVIVLSLIRGPAPPCYDNVITRARPVPTDPRLRPARQPPVSSEPCWNSWMEVQRPGADGPGIVDVARVMLRIERADQQTQHQLWVLNERLPEPLSVESRSCEFWVSYPDEFGEAEAREQVRKAIEEVDLHLIGVT
jgi:hypothetical protein